MFTTLAKTEHALSAKTSCFPRKRTPDVIICKHLPAFACIRHSTGTICFYAKHLDANPCTFCHYVPSEPCFCKSYKTLITYLIPLNSLTTVLKENNATTHPVSDPATRTFLRCDEGTLQAFLQRSGLMESIEKLLGEVRDTGTGSWLLVAIPGAPSSDALVMFGTVMWFVFPEWCGAEDVHIGPFAIEVWISVKDTSVKPILLYGCWPELCVVTCADCGHQGKLLGTRQELHTNEVPHLAAGLACTNGL